MATPKLDINTGVSFTFAGTSLIVSRTITDVKLPGAEVEVFDSTGSPTAGGAVSVAKTYIPADIIEIDNFEFTCQHMQDDDFYGEVGSEGSCTVTLPYSGSSLLFNGIIKSYIPQQASFNEPMFADVVVKVSGDLTPTAG